MTNGDGGTTYRLGRWLGGEDWPLWAPMVAALAAAGTRTGA
jgi:hypothetical protein